MLFLGIKKITLKEKYAFVVLDVQLEIFDIHRGICAINWAELAPFYSPTRRNGEENIRGKLPVYGHMFNSFCGPNSLLPYIELTSSEDCTISGSTVHSSAYKRHEITKAKTIKLLFY